MLPALWEIPGASRSSYPRRLISKLRPSNAHDCFSLSGASVPSARKPATLQLWTLGFDQAVRRKPLAGADAGAMGIQSISASKALPDGSCARLCHASGGELEQI